MVPWIAGEKENKTIIIIKKKTHPQIYITNGPLGLTDFYHISFGKHFLFSNSFIYTQKLCKVTSKQKHRDIFMRLKYSKKKNKQTWNMGRTTKYVRSLMFWKNFHAKN